MDEYLDFFDEIAEAIEQVFMKFKQREIKLLKTIYFKQSNF